MGSADRQSARILRKHFSCLKLICLLILPSACATEPIWIIPGNLGTTHQWAGALPDVGGARIARLRIRVTGMGPPSPSSGSRALDLTLTCIGPAATQVRWHEGLVEPDMPNHSSDFTCGEHMTLYITDENTDRLVVLEFPAESSGEVNYTLTATVPAPC
jgi:hypothetical protein